MWLLASGLVPARHIHFTARWVSNWQCRYIEWFRDLGFLQKPGVETKAAKDTAAFVDPPAR
jgi:hypothetical protein